MHKQFFGGDCGHYALLHCLESFGINITMEKLREYSQIGFFEAAAYGIDEQQIVETIKHMNYQVLIQDNLSIKTFKKTLDKYLEDGYATIVSMDDGAHWATIIQYEDTPKRLYRCVDSKPRDRESYDVWRSWAEVLVWIETEEDMCIIGLKP